MKHPALLVTIFAAVLLAVDANGQTLQLSELTSGNTETMTLRFLAPPDRNFVIYEARPQVRSASECFAATDFSTAVPVGSDRATVSFDPGTGAWFLKNSNSSGSADGCSVLLVRSSVDVTDLAVFRAQFGASQGLLENAKPDKEHDAAEAQRSTVRSNQVTFSSIPTI